MVEGITDASGWGTLLLELSWGVIGFFSGHELISWINLGAALMVATAIYGWSNRHREERPAFLAYLFPRKSLESASARLDMLYYLLIQPLAILAIFPLAGLMRWATWGVAIGLEESLGGVPFATPEWLGRALYTLALFLSIDFGFWYSHYLTHKRPILWHFHKIHHTAEVLVPFTALRFHPLDVLWNASFAGLFAVILGGLVRYLFFPDGEAYQLFGNNVIVALAYLTTHNFRHTHIWIDYPRWLRFLISPAQHQMHHSAEKRHIDKNFGYLLSCWDRWFGTLYVPEGREEFAVGVKGMPSEGLRNHRSVESLLVAPFLDIAHERRRRREKAGK